MPVGRTFVERFTTVSDWESSYDTLPESRHARRGFAIPPLYLSRPTTAVLVAQIVPWPWTVDRNNVPFTNVVGLLCRFPKTIDNGTGAVADDPYLERADYEGLIAVPKEFPTGYERRKMHDWYDRNHRGLGYDLSTYAGGDVFNPRTLDALVGTPRVTGSDGVLYDLDTGWMPQCIDDYFQAVSGSTSGVVFSTAGIGRSPGWRDARLFGDCLGGTATLKIEYSDDEVTWTTAQTHTFDHESFDLMTGAIGPASIGTAKYWQVDLTTDDPGMLWDLYLSPRTDIPLWFDVGGIDDSGNGIFAAGGIVSGSIPGYP